RQSRDRVQTVGIPASPRLPRRSARGDRVHIDERFAIAGRGIQLEPKIKLMIRVVEDLDVRPIAPGLALNSSCSGNRERTAIIAIVDAQRRGGYGGGGQQQCCDSSEDSLKHVGMISFRI